MKRFDLRGWIARESGFRFLARRRVAASVAVLALALALGGQALVLALGRSFLESSFGMPEPDRLFVVAPVRSLEGRGEVVFADAYVNYVRIRETTRSFSDVAVLYQATASLNRGDEARPLRVARVSASFFATAGVQPVLGRAIERVEEGPQSARVAVVSDGLWRSLGSDRGALGGTLLIDGAAHVVVGVMPPGFEHPLTTDVWLPFDLASADAWERVAGARSLTVYGRLRDGVSREAANAEMEELTQRAIDASPENREYRYTLQTIRDVLVPNAVGVLRLVRLGAGLLVVLAAANLASVLIAWGFDRRQELAVRLALGAGRGGVLRLLVAQSLVVASAGGLLGIGVAWLAVPLVKRFEVAPSFRFFMDELRVDPAVLVTMAVVIAAVGVLAGVAPAFLLRHTGVGDALRSGGRGSTLSAAAIRWQKAMVLAQTSLAVVILSAAMLVMLSLRNLARVPLGFEPDGRVVTRLQLGDRHVTHAARALFGERLLENLALQPELRSAAFTSTLPVGDVRTGGRIVTDLAELEAGREPLLIHFRRVSAGYSETMGIPLIEGRAFDSRDGADGVPVALISNALARRLWPGGSAVGRRFYRIVGGTPQQVEVIGVTGDVPDAGQAAPPGETVYMHWQQASAPAISIVVRTSVAEATALAAIDRAVTATDAIMATNNPASLERLVEQANALPRFQTLLLSCFATIALMLLLLGSYGVITQLVAAREREFALRMFFGAPPRRLGVTVFRQITALSALGTVFGVIGVWLLASTLEPLLFGIPARSPLLLTCAATAVITLAVLASASPTLRAMRLDVRRVTQP